MKPQQRWLIIGSLLLATLAGAYFVADEPVPETTGKKIKTARPSTSPLAGEARRAGKDQAPGELLSFPQAPVAEAAVEGEVATVIDPFRNKSWFIPPPPPPVAKPVAPALPFQYLGKLIEADEIRVFLFYQGKYLIAKPGDVINDTYRVEAIGAGKMTFLYQPLKEKQTLSIGGDS